MFEAIDEVHVLLETWLLKMQMCCILAFERRFVSTGNCVFAVFGHRPEALLTLLNHKNGISNRSCVFVVVQYVWH